MSTPKKEHGFANSVEHLARVQARGRPYPKVVSWARKNGYCLSGTSASLYSTRLATASATTAADAAAIAGDELIAKKRSVTRCRAGISQPRPCTRPRRRNRERNTTAYGTAAPAAAAVGGGAWVAFSPWECGFSPPPPFASLHPHGLWCFFNLTPGFCSYWKMGGVPRENFLFLDLFVFLILKLDFLKNIFRN